MPQPPSVSRTEVLKKIPEKLKSTGHEIKTHVRMAVPVVEPEKKKPVIKLFEKRAVLLPAAKELFRNCGVDPDYVNPIPIGEGLTSVVYEYTPPEGNPKVVKIAKKASKGFMSTGHLMDADNVSLIKKYFGKYAVDTQIIHDEKTGKHIEIQDKIIGKAITNRSETPEIRAKLADLMRLNREMMHQTSHSLDFIGVPGAWSWFRHQFRQILTRKSEFQISNIMVDDKGDLHIVDSGMLRFRGASFKQRAISNIGFLFNRLIMRWYFGVDIRPKDEIYIREERKKK